MLNGDSVIGFTYGYLKEFLWDDEPHPDTEVVVRKEEGSCGRWTVGHTIVFRHKDRFFRFFYTTGATERQEDSGTFREHYGSDEDEFADIEEVFPVEVTKIRYLSQSQIDKRAAK